MEATPVNVLSEETRLKGVMVGENVSILGVFEGELQVRGRLDIGPSGRVKGVVRASAVAVNGAFEGEIHAERLTFGPTARATGSFEAQRLSMIEGAFVEGPVNLPAPVREAAQPQVALPPPPASPADEAGPQPEPVVALEAGTAPALPPAAP